MFVTPTTAVVYSRDQLLSLRSRTQLLDTDQRSLITHLRIGRHGCRAGNHWRRRLLAARSVTSSVSCMTTCWEIPTIICHRGMFYKQQRSAVQPVPRRAYICVSAPDHHQPNNDIINSAVNLAASGTADVVTDRRVNESTASTNDYLSNYRNDTDSLGTEPDKSTPSASSPPSVCSVPSVPSSLTDPNDAVSVLDISDDPSVF